MKSLSKGERKKIAGKNATDGFERNVKKYLNKKRSLFK